MEEVKIEEKHKEVIFLPEVKNDILEIDEANSGELKRQ